MKKIVKVIFLVLMACQVNAQSNYNNSKFHQLEEWWPTPNEYRNGAGAPGYAYWQQRADYDINVKLDEDKQSISGSEKIVYYNNSPDALKYVWLQLDQNIYKKTSMTELSSTQSELKNMSFNSYNSMYNDFDGGFNIEYVKDAKGQAMRYTIVNTMMRVDLPQPLKKGEQLVMQLAWNYKINNTKIKGGRSGGEYFEDDKNWIDCIAQFYPRMCVYNDVQGWNHKQFLGSGEFATCFGNYKVNITAPADHVVTATGELINASEVLKPIWRERLTKAKTSEKPVLIITQEEATENEKSRASGTKTWKFVAENVRDFAFASSRKYIWDAMNVKVGKKDVMAMSFYPKEGNPLWGKYSTHAIAHTLKVYSRYTVNYPYPVAISVNGPIGGMEYPMICFNGPRPEKDGTYSARTKYGLITVVIHEVGHNFFPMIINSDERQWAWMDEGLNTFCQYLTEQEWEENYPSGRGEARGIVPYMSADKSVINPIMTNSESILQLGNNAYGKPATALNILRETVMGRELFDKAFKEYAERWAFKHPMPADFFRTMEDASGVDLDWFWRGWFYGTEPCDIALSSVKYYTIDTQNPVTEKTKRKAAKESEAISISEQRNKTDIKEYLVEKHPELVDFYNTYDPNTITNYDKEKYSKYDESLSEEERKKNNANLNYYVLEFQNVGGLIMPIILEMEYVDGTKEMMRIPAEIWRKNNEKVSKLIITAKKVKQFSVDPLQETADINLNNNYYPAKEIESQFQLYKEQRQREQNLMQLEKSGKL
jgi:hypothetical protein